MNALTERLRRGAELFAAAMFAIMFATFVVQVVSRYVFDDPVTWSLEICSIAYVWIVFFSSATILKPRQHITFDLLYVAMSPRWKRRFAIFTTASLLAIFAVCLPTTIGYVLFAGQYHTLILHIRMDVIYSCFVIFMVGAIVGSALRLRRLLSRDWHSDIERGRPDMSFAATLMITSFFVWGALGMPIGFAMLCSAFVYLLLMGQDIGLVASQSLNGLFRSFVLLAVPLFIVAAEIMNAGTVSERLLKFSSLIVGRIRGGLAHVTVIASMIFSGMSGSAIADAAGPGKLMIEMMLKEGRYQPGFAGSLAAAAATIGPIIPPSIPMVLYAMVANTSVGYLFLGGFFPGVLMGVSLMTVIAFVARRDDLPVEPRIQFREVPGIMRDSLPAVMLPVILLGGIYSGVVTPTEAAAVAAAYALLLACGLYRALPFEGLLHLFVNAARSTAVVALVVAGALLVNYVVAAERIPNEIGAWIESLHVSKLGFLLIINLLFLVLGCFLDTLLMLLVIVPIAMPTIRALGIDPVHFGVTTIVNLMIGMVTPPYSELLFVVTGITGIPLTAMYRYIWPFIFALIVALFVMLVVPDIVLWLPMQFGYIPGE